MTYQRRIISLSLNEGQERDLERAMYHAGIDSPSAMYRMLLRKYIRDNGLDEEVVG